MLGERDLCEKSQFCRWVSSSFIEQGKPDEGKKLLGRSRFAHRCRQHQAHPWIEMDHSSSSSCAVSYSMQGFHVDFEDERIRVNGGKAELGCSNLRDSFLQHPHPINFTLGYDHHQGEYVVRRTFVQPPFNKANPCGNAG